MADLFTVVNNMQAGGDFAEIGRDVRAQFGAGSRRYLGAELLPERNVEENAYRETAVRFRSGVIANAGTRYSPVQLKDTGELVASFLVELGESDIGIEMTSRDYDALIKLLGRGNDMEAMGRLAQFADANVNVGMLEFNELQRWQALVDAAVVRQGDGFTETVPYSNPSGHRITAGGSFSNDAYDPFDTIYGIKDMLAAKGYDLSAASGRIIGSRKIVSLMAQNDKVRTRTFGGSSRNLATGAVLGRTNLDGINQALQADDLPAIETYDLRYRTQTGTGRFLRDDALVFIAATEQGETVDMGDEQRFIPDTLGYMAVGRTTGQEDSGRVIKAYPKDNKPPRIEFEGWQTSLPVITEPEAVAVVTGIS